MKKIFFLLIFISQQILAHNLNYENAIPRTWELDNPQRLVKGFFHNYNQNQVVLENQNGELMQFALSDFSKNDQTYIAERIAKIEQLNQQIIDNQAVNQKDYFDFYKKSTIWLFAMLLIGYGIYRQRDKTLKRLVFPIMALATIISIYGFGKKVIFGTDPNVLDAAFQPFKPNVKTRWDNNYFYIESNGLPTTHEMMTGITGWQQQVPIPQCYIGNNAWQVPLNPTIAATPVPVNSQHFLRGAVAIAVNGIPIFNPYTNTGVDAFVDGQLDNWGGHSGRADDYHYHIAPLHLYDYTTKTLPVAYALDGFAIYGAFEPDGAAMKSLDANHGHYGSDGVYHYHGTKEKPYMIGNMVGKVTEDNTMQIIPQPSAKSPRPATTPLKGAVITSCKSNATNNGYILVYTLNNKTYTVDYSWTNSGVYTYKFIAPDGTSTISTYNGQKPCFLTTAIADFEQLEGQIVVFPNPTQEVLNIQLKNDISEQNINEISLFDAQGKKVFSSDKLLNNIDLRGFERGVYLLEVGVGNGVLMKKIVKE